MLGVVICIFWVASFFYAATAIIKAGVSRLAFYRRPADPRPFSFPLLLLRSNSVEPLITFAICLVPLVRSWMPLFDSLVALAEGDFAFIVQNIPFLTPMLISMTLFLIGIPLIGLCAGGPEVRRISRQLLLIGCVRILATLISALTLGLLLVVGIVALEWSLRRIIDRTRDD